MKTKIVFISFILIMLSGNAQVREVGIRQYYKQGDIELSFFSNLGKVIRTVTTSSSYHEEYIYENNYLHFFIGATVGYYIIDGLSIEPEVDFITIIGSDPSYAIIGNLCYTVYSPLENNYFYVKLGYGWGAMENNYHADNGGYRIINSAIGFKARILSSFTYRVELNYRNLSKEYSAKDEYYDYSESINSNSISISSGINFLF